MALRQGTRSTGTLNIQGIRALQCSLQRPTHPPLKLSAPSCNPPSRCRTQLSRRTACGGATSRIVNDALAMRGSSSVPYGDAGRGKAASIWRITSPWVTTTSELAGMLRALPIMEHRGMAIQIEIHTHY